jgi:hypothetical protein
MFHVISWCVFIKHSKISPYIFPFIACEIFTCEVDVIMKTLVENEEVCFSIDLLLFPCNYGGSFSLAVDKSHDLCSAHKFTFLLPEFWPP